MNIAVVIVLSVLTGALFSSSGREILAVALDTWTGTVTLWVGVVVLTGTAASVLLATSPSKWGRVGSRSFLAVPPVGIAICLWQIGALWTWHGAVVVLGSAIWIAYLTRQKNLGIPPKWAVLSAAIVIAIAAFVPVWVGALLKPLGVLFVLSGCWILMLDGVRRLGYLRAVLIAAGVCFLLTSLFFRTHDMRVMSDHKLLADIRSAACPKVQTVGGLASLPDVLDCWIASHAGPDGQATMVLVATAGGGSRAAEWTADVLARLDLKAPGFSRQLFAISSVSGGSLGSAVFAAALHERDAGRHCQSNPKELGSLEPCVHEALQSEGLGALLAAWLSTDVMTALIGPASHLLNDRAAALEKAWESTWHDTYHDHLMGKSFGALFQRSPWPALYVNSTSVGAGNVAIFSSAQGLDAEDSLLIDFGSPFLRTSTIVGTSARFAFVSPAGSLALPGGRDAKGNAFLLTVRASAADWAAAKPQYADTLVDGGYADNFGDVTLRRLVAAIDDYQCEKVWDRDDSMRAIPCSQLLQTHRFIRFVVIQISSDPTLEQPGCQEAPLAPGLPAPASAAQWNFAVPFLTLENTRQYNGIIYAAQMASLVRSLYATDAQARVFGTFAKGEVIFEVPYFHFGLGHLVDAKKQGGRAPSLNWVLSQSTREHIAQHLSECVDPSAPKIAEILRTGMYHARIADSH
jgi:hypothetical protein